MSSSQPPPKPSPQPTQAFDAELAKMMQAEVNEGGPPPATPCDTPVDVIPHAIPAEAASPATGTDEGGGTPAPRSSS